MSVCKMCCRVLLLVVQEVGWGLHTTALRRHCVRMFGWVAVAGFAHHVHGRQMVQCLWH